MARADIRNDGRPITVQHHSARGDVKRNSGNFTRGSQLLSHEVLMWLSGAKMPFLMWLGVLLLAYVAILSVKLDENNVQLICMRVLSGLWDWVALDPMKPVNLRLPDNSVRHTYMGYVPYVPDVALAWSKATKGLLGAMLLASFITVPLTIWYVDFSRRRGKNILEERHERGAMLVERDVLLQEINQHNQAEFVKDAGDLFPNHTPKAVLAMPFDARKAAGIHHPYTLAGIQYPHRLEQSHTMLIGTTGAGKTTALRKLIKQMQERKDSAVVFDLTGAYVEAFYDPSRDTILNPLDARCPAWTIFNDCTTYSEFTAAAAALIPSDGGSAKPFWAMAARTLFIEMCLKLIEKKQTSNRALAENLMTADLKQVHKYLAKTIADPLTAPEAARMAESIRAVFNTNAQVLRFLPNEGEPFSIRDWITRDKKPGSILFITSNYTDLEMNKALLTLWSNLAIYSLMSMPRTRSLRTWFMFDELGALHRLPAIESGLQTARNFGGAMILGLHSFDKLVQVYGEENARNLSSLARTKLILAAADLETAEQCSNYIGSREVRQMDEAYSYGYNNTRDASTLTPRKQVEPLVIPDDITNLPSMHGFVKFPDGFPAARIQLQWEHYALVQHDTSRALDPQLHVHALVANLTQLADGKWQALHADKIWSNNTVIGSIYHGFLRAEMEKLGYQIETRGKHGTFEVVGVPKDVMEVNSQRRAEILKIAGELGIKSGQGMRSITARSRDPKLSLEDRDKLIADWREKAPALGFDGESLRDKAMAAAMSREGAGPILAIDSKGVTVETAGKEQLTLPLGDPMLSRIDLAYSLNMHMAQGMTAEKAITAMSSVETNLTNQQLFNVAVTRVRSELTVVVNDTQKVFQQLDRNTGIKTSAVETVGRLNIDGPGSSLGGTSPASTPTVSVRIGQVRMSGADDLSTLPRMP